MPLLWAAQAHSHALSRPGRVQDELVELQGAVARAQEHLYAVVLPHVGGAVAGAGLDALGVRLGANYADVERLVIEAQQRAHRLVGRLRRKWTSEALDHCRSRPAVIVQDAVELRLAVNPRAHDLIRSLRRRALAERKAR